MKSSSLILIVTTVVVGAAALAGTLWLAFPQIAFAQQPGAGPGVDPGMIQWGFASAALSAGLSALAAGYAVAQVGSAAIGALAEKPELMGRVLVMVGLAEGIAIYGLIVSILILNRLG